MTEVQEKASLVFDDKEYIIEDLSDTAKYMVSQIQDLNAQIIQVKGKLDQLEVAKRGFTEMLGTEINREEKEEGAE